MINKKKGILSYIAEGVMLIISFISLIPFYYLVVNTFKTSADATFHPMSLPSKLYFENYITAFNQMKFFNAFKNTLLMTVVAVVLIIVFGAMAAYPIARRKNVATKILMLYFLLGFMIPVQTTMVPLFLIMQKLKLVNSLIGMIILYSGGCTFAFFIYQGFIQTVPKDLEEAAIIDGCSIWKTFWLIVFPLLAPITATIAIFETMWTWNDFLLAYMFLSSRKVSTLILEVYRGVGQFSNDWSIMLTTMVIVLFPLVIFYLVMQKNIIAGLTTGAIKG